MFIKDLVMWRHYNVILENSNNTTPPWQCLAISNNSNHFCTFMIWNIGFKHQRESKQNSDNKISQVIGKGNLVLRLVIFLQIPLPTMIYLFNHMEYHSEQLLNKWYNFYFIFHPFSVFDVCLRKVLLYAV